MLDPAMQETAGVYNISNELCIAYDGNIIGLHANSKPHVLYMLHISLRSIYCYYLFTHKYRTIKRCPY